MCFPSSVVIWVVIIMLQYSPLSNPPDSRWDGSYVSSLCSGRSRCNRLLLLGTQCTLEQVVDPALGQWRLSLFVSQWRDQFSNKGSTQSGRGVMFPAKWPACYRREGSIRTFGPRINAAPHQNKLAQFIYTVIFPLGSRLNMPVFPSSFFPCIPSYSVSLLWSSLHRLKSAQWKQ